MTEPLDEGELKKADSVLMAWRDRLFYLGPNFSIHEPEQPYLAIGSGEDFALGALDALEMLAEHVPALHPQDKLEIAVKAAISRNVYCVEPVRIEEVRA